MESVYERCENCEHVNRGYDEYSHNVYWISDRCPIHNLIVLYTELHKERPPVEWVVSYLGCAHFKEDAEYKKQNEEIDALLKEMDARRKEKAATDNKA